MNVVEARNKIISLGWTHIGAFWYEWPVKNEIYVDEYSNRPLDYRLNFVDFDRYITMEAYERNSFEWEVCYKGSCRNEEELLYLMKNFNMI